MQTKRVRVVLGSDGPQARDVLSGLVDKQHGVVVGQAANVIEAINLTRNLRPDVVILDCYLPHISGLRQIPSSRAGGLDAAQSIIAQVPNARILLVDNLDASLPLEAMFDPAVAVCLYENSGTSTAAPLVLADLSPAAATDSPIFAHIFAKRLPSSGWYAGLAEQVMLFGTGAVLFGLMMMVTGLLFVPGILLAALGGAAAGVGFVTRAVLRHFMKQGIKDEVKK